MSRRWWALHVALFLALILVNGPAFAQVGGPAETPESDRDASSSEDGPALGQSQQNQTKSQQQKDRQEQDARQEKNENKQDRGTRADRPMRQDRPMKLERFHK